MYQIFAPVARPPAMPGDDREPPVRRGMLEQEDRQQHAERAERLEQHRPLGVDGGVEHGVAQAADDRGGPAVAAQDRAATSAALTAPMPMKASRAIAKPVGSEMSVPSAANGAATTVMSGGWMKRKSR